MSVGGSVLGLFLRPVVSVGEPLSLMMDACENLLSFSANREIKGRRRPPSSPLDPDCAGGGGGGGGAWTPINV